MSKYVYLVRFANIVKIGYSKNLTMNQQIYRYNTYYPKFDILFFSHNTPDKFERYLKYKLTSHNIRGELFSEFAYDDAVKLCNRECKQIYLPNE